MLSFKGLAVNLTFAMLSLLFGAIAYCAREGQPANLDPENYAFTQILPWYPIIFIAMVLGLHLFASRKMRALGLASSR